jgi:hypothetical protein
MITGVTSQRIRVALSEFAAGASGRVTIACARSGGKGLSVIKARARVFVEADNAVNRRLFFSILGQARNIPIRSNITEFAAAVNGAAFFFVLDGNAE